jgi:GNAT superfamily N-acetyltransferase
MHEQPTIRKARTEDAPQISELIFRVAHYFASSASGEVAPWFLESITPSAIADNINDSKFNYLVGLVGQALAGVLAVRDTTHVHHLFVAPEFHRKGLAAKLWERAKADALASGNKEGFWVRSSEFAVPVYERFGFRVIGARAEKDGIAFIPMKLESHYKHG